MSARMLSVVAPPTPQPVSESPGVLLGDTSRFWNPVLQQTESLAVRLG